MKSYSAHEFFYDFSFIDYNRDYILEFEKPTLEGFTCPKKVLLANDLKIFSMKPTTNTMNSLQIVIGSFNGEKDQYGIYGECKFVSDKIYEISNELFNIGFQLAPIGDLMYTGTNQIIEYFLRGLYLKPIALPKNKNLGLS